MPRKRQCPHCEQWFQPHAHARHIKVCERRPSDEELIQMRLDGLSRDAMADIIGVSHATVKKWMVASGADKISIRTKRKRTIIVFPGKALRYGQEGGCDRCKDIELCAELEQSRERVRCEAPDDVDLADEQARHNGKPRLEPVCDTSVWETLFSLSG